MQNSSHDLLALTVKRSVRDRVTRSLRLALRYPHNVSFFPKFKNLQ